MVFSEYLNSLSPKVGMSERRAKVKEIAEATCKSETAVYAWANGEREPDMLTKKVISGLLNIPVDELFPQAK
jgi:transcriptional regulator with XRE-family HTH domain